MVTWEERLHQALVDIIVAWDDGWTDSSESGSFILALENARKLLHPEWFDAGSGGDGGASAHPNRRVPR